MAKVALLLIYVALSAFGLYKIKSADGVVSIAYALGFVFYAAGFLVWLYMLQRLPLSIVFPVAAGSLIIATQILGYFFLEERVDAVQLAGVALILSGIVAIYART